MLKADLIEGIIGLPAALFYNTGIPASIWIINKIKPKHLKDKVIILEASQEYKEGKNQNELLGDHIEKIANAYDALKEVHKFMRVVEVKEIADNDYNLNISRYIDTSDAEEEINLSGVKSRIIALEEKEKEIDEKLMKYLNELGV